MIIEIELLIIIFCLRKVINIEFIEALGVSICFTICHWLIFKVIILAIILLYLFGMWDLLEVIIIRGFA